MLFIVMLYEFIRRFVIRLRMICFWLILGMVIFVGLSFFFFFCGWKYVSYIWGGIIGGNVLYCYNDWSVLCVFYDVLGFMFLLLEFNWRRGF